MAKKKTNKELYEAQQKKILDIITNLRESGYDVDLDLPKQPKRVSEKALKNIKKYTKKYIQANAYTYNEKNSKISYKEHQEYLKNLEQQPVRTANENDALPSFHQVALNNYISEFGKFHYANLAYNIQAKVRGWINKLISDNGIEAVVQMLYDAKEGGIEFTYEMSLNESKFYAYIETMVGYLRDQGEIYQDEVMELYEQLEQFTSWEEPK